MRIDLVADLALVVRFQFELPLRAWSLCLIVRESFRGGRTSCGL